MISRSITGSKALRNACRGVFGSQSPQKAASHTRYSRERKALFGAVFAEL